MLQVYQQTQGRDGYISLEVSPYLAMHTHETIEEARRLWREVDRPNLMVKVPGTKPGIPAIRQMISEGVNINVTLLFSADVYAEVAEAYIAGLEDFVAKGGDPHKIASVASFFISRIDSLVDEPDRQKDRRLPAIQPRKPSSKRSRARRDRQRQADLPALQGNLFERALAAAGAKRRADPAPAVGQHRYQERGL
jgi:transaldolase